jgi:hypothetical protein
LAARGRTGLIVGWKIAAAGEAPRALETALLTAFRERYGAARFANLM